MSTLIGILGILVLFGVAVTIHEFGHFFAAKLFGVRVERFSLGMGPVVASFQKGETEYALSALPLGGYVKLTGPMSRELEAEAEVLDAEDEVKRLEALRAQQGDRRARWSPRWAGVMAVALALGAASLLQRSAEAAFAVAATGLVVAAAAAWSRFRHHRALDALDLAELDRSLVEARRQVADLRTRLDADAGEKRLEEAVPGITKVTAAEERLASSLIEDNIALRSKPFHAKIAIFAAGCFMNVLLAFLLLVGMNWIGVEVSLPEGTDVEAPRPGTPLAAFDVREGDRIVAIDGAPTATWLDVSRALARAARDDRAAVVVLERDAAEPGLAPARLELNLPWAEPEAVTGQPPDGLPESERALYLGAPYLHFAPRDPVIVAETIHNQPAERGGLRIHDRIVAIAGRPITSWHALLDIVEASPDRPLVFDVVRPRGGEPGAEAAAAGERLALTITPLPDKQGRGRIGLIRGYAATLRERDSFPVAVMQAGIGLVDRSIGFVEGLWMLASGQIARPLEQLGGPLSIGYLAARKANEGLERYLGFFVMINIILAIMNLLPIPLLDGGHIAFSLVEAVLRRPIPARVLLAVYNVSFYLIIGLAVFLLGNDIYQNSWRYFAWVGRLVDLTVAG